jgi:xanthine dehydrogenase accessory factor
MRGRLELVVLIKGAGEMASGVAHRLTRAGFRVCLTDIAQPQAVRRGVSFCEAVYDGEKTVEGLTAVLVEGLSPMLDLWREGKIPLIVDPEAKIREILHPDVVVDAILAKRNLGTRLDDAPLVIGLGPGFRVGRDVHMIVETNRGHNLGRLLLEGEAEPNTGIPGAIGGYTAERVLRAPEAGRFTADGYQIGDTVKAGEVVAHVGAGPVLAQIGGVVRGLIREGIPVERGMKLGDIDPRGKKEYCFTISDKARAIAGGVLEGILSFYNR